MEKTRNMEEKKLCTISTKEEQDKCHDRSFLVPSAEEDEYDDAKNKLMMAESVSENEIL